MKITESLAKEVNVQQACIALTIPRGSFYRWQDQMESARAERPRQLTIHADQGSSMKSKPVAFLMADLGVTKSHSRPYVSNDNPYSESHFKTLKYRPEFPDRFGAIVDARAFCQPFFSWYNGKHYHSGIGFLTPEDVHYGRSEQIIKEGQIVLNAAYEKHPRRFKGNPPTPAELPPTVWINKPASPRSNPALQ
jgi:putative transposase